MIEEMNGCTGVTEACGGKDISWSRPIIKDTGLIFEVEIESECKTCGKTEKHVMPLMSWLSPKLVELYNKKNEVVVVVVG